MRSIKWGKGGTRGTDRIFGVAHFTPRPPGRSARRPPDGTGAVHRHSSVHRSTRSHIPDGNSTEATRPHVRLSAGVPFSLRPLVPAHRKRQAMCPSTSYRSSCASSLRGGCSTRASLQSRSPTLTPPRPNARPANPASSGRASAPDGPTARADPGPASPEGYPSLRAKRRSTPLLRGPNPSLLRPTRASALAPSPAGQMRSYALSRTEDAVPAKGLQTGNYVEVTQVDGERSSGALLRRQGGIPRSGLSSIQHGGSADDRDQAGVRVEVASARCSSM